MVPDERAAGKGAATNRGSRPRIRRAVGWVERVEAEGTGLQRLAVRLEGTPHGEAVPAVCFPELTGRVEPGRRVLLNTTAVDLGLGSGGFHFVMACLDDGESAPSGAPLEFRLRGHIMKLRYTPLQLALQTVDEEGSPHREVMLRAENLAQQPVVIGCLHSHLIPAVAGILRKWPEAKVAYVMTDGGALAAAWSRSVDHLRERGALCGCVTSGHAFGGDLEAVNIYSALLAARWALGADVTVALMGPGVTGTGSPFGHTALEVAPLVDAVAALGGRPVVIPRLSEADPRPRHRGLSHHTLTALGRLTYARAAVPLPPLSPALEQKVRAQISAAGIDQRHDVCPVPWQPGPEDVEGWMATFTSMGRRYEDDPIFFQAGLCAGYYAASLLTEDREVSG